MAHTQSISNAYGFPTQFLKALLNDSDYATCRRMADEAIEKKTFETTLYGINVGQYCLFETTLIHKKISLDYTPDQWADYKVYLYNSLITLTGFAKYLDANKVDAVISYCPQYSNVNPCTELAKQRGIRFLFLESGINLGHRLGSMRVWEWDAHRLMNPALTSWGSVEDHRVTNADASRMADHFRELLGGVSFTVYSSAFRGAENIRQRWGIAPHQKILLLTTSSFDERFANHLIGASPPELFHSDVFADQSTWLAETLKWVSERPEYFLIIRQHPRDFPNKRDHRRSEQSYLFEDIFKDLPPNAAINAPSDDISYYGMLEEADVLLTAWSSTATEALMLGMPVVTYDGRLPLYPPDITYAGSSRESYFAQIEAALADGWSFSNVRKAFRWLCYVYEQATIPISPFAGRFELTKKSRLDRFRQKLEARNPAFARALELMTWRTARSGAAIVNQMLLESKTSILAVRPAIDPALDDEPVIRDQLDRLYKLLYGADDRERSPNGLSGKIRRFLDSHGSTTPPQA